MRMRRVRREKEEERMLVEGVLEEEERFGSRSESKGSSLRTITDTTSTMRWSSALPEGAGIYVLPPIPEMERLGEEEREED